MDFLIGSLTAFAAMYVSYIIITRSNITISTKINKISQSYVYEIIKPALPILEALQQYKTKDTQSRLFEKKLSTRVLVMGNLAYWIKDNQVYSAEMQNNEIDNNSVKVVDIMGMDDVQLKKIMFIIDTLTEGSNGNDSGNTSYPKF